MASIKSFVSKMKKKSAEYKEKQNEKHAKSKGFSSGKAYNFYKETAKTEGEEIGKSKLRKKELKRIKDEAEADVMMGNFGRMGKYRKVQKKVQKGFDGFQKGMGVYNEMMGGLQSLGAGNDSFYPKQNSRQAYSSGYGINKPRKRSKSKKTKSRKSKPRKQESFWDQYRY